MTELTIVSGGLRVPSSTRLLADRLGRVRRSWPARARSVSRAVIELRPLARPITDAMLTGFADHRAGGRLRDCRARGCG